MQYKLKTTGGVLRSDGAHIPESMDNTDWIKYLEWVSNGNTPLPEHTPKELSDISIRDEIRELKTNFVKTAISHFKMTLEIFMLLKQFTDCTNADVDPTLMSKAGTWVSWLNRLEEID